MISQIAKKLYSVSVHSHPHKFRQYIQLTDGSLTLVPSLVPDRPFIKLNIDSLSHPSWNPRLHNQLLLDEQGEVAKFRSKFGQYAEEGDFLDECNALVDPALKPARLESTGKKRAVAKGKKK